MYLRRAIDSIVLWYPHCETALRLNPIEALSRQPQYRGVLSSSAKGHSSRLLQRPREQAIIAQVEILGFSRQWRHLVIKTRRVIAAKFSAAPRNFLHLMFIFIFSSNSFFWGLVNFAHKIYTWAISYTFSPSIFRTKIKLVVQITKYPIKKSPYIWFTCDQNSLNSPAPISLLSLQLAQPRLTF